VFEVSREWKRVHFGKGLPEVEITDSISIEYYCSDVCLAISRADVMEHAGVPIRPTGIGPIEACAKCRGPVDMTEFHLTYVEEEYIVDESFGVKPVSTHYLAILCRRCRPYAPF
jgi:hypothetical protein